MRDLENARLRGEGRKGLELSLVQRDFSLSVMFNFL